MKSLTRCCAFALSCILALSAARADENGWQPIFDGETLEGWTFDEKFWRVEDGIIVGETTPDNPTPGNTFLIWTEREPGDFELKLRYRITAGNANSGIQVRSERVGDYAMRGYQPDIASTDWITGILYEERGRGIMARRGESVVIDGEGQRTATRFAEEAALLEHVHADDWNEYHIVCRGNTLVSKINGQKMHELVDDAPQARREGLLGLQLHSGPPMTLHFKDIRIRPIAE